MDYWSNALDQFTKVMGDFYKIEPKILRGYFFKNIIGEQFPRGQEMQAWKKLEANYKSTYEAKLL